MGRVTSAVGRIRSVSPFLKRANRVLVVFGIVGDFLVSVIQSAAALNPGIWVAKGALILANANIGIMANVEMLKAGVPWWKFIILSLSIWGQIFVIYFLISFFARTENASHAGDYTAWLSQYIWIAIFVIAPIQFVGGVLYQVGTLETVTVETVISGREVIPFYGLWTVASNYGIWVTPILDLAGMIPFGEELYRHVPLEYFESSPGVGEPGSNVTIGSG